MGQTVRLPKKQIYYLKKISILMNMNVRVFTLLSNGKRNTKGNSSKFINFEMLYL